MGFKTDILQVEEIISDSTIVLETLTTESIALTLNNITTPTDVNASGGGLTLKGTSDKTILWDDTNDNWTSNQSFNIASSLDYKVNNVSVLNATTLGSSVLASSLTSLGTITSLVATTADINGGTIDGATIGGSTAGAITGTTITANTSLTTSIIKPSADSTTAISVTKADGTSVLMNFDTTNSRVGIGTVDPANNLEVLSTNYTTIRVSTYSTTLATSPNILFVKSHNATAKTNTTTLTGEVLGYIECYGINSANGVGSSAKIQFTQNGTAGASTIPTDTIFFNATDSVGLTERMRISSTGNVTITTADDPQITLTDSTAVTSGTVKYNSTTESIDFIFS